MRNPNTNEIQVKLLERTVDTAFLWQALHEQRNGRYPDTVEKGDTRLQLYLCNLNGEFIASDSTINRNDPNDAFIKCFNQKRPEWTARIKLFLGEFNYTADEMLALENYFKIMEPLKGVVIKYFREVIIPRDPRNVNLFIDSPLYSFLIQNVAPSNTQGALAAAKSLPQLSLTATQGNKEKDEKGVRDEAY